MSTYDVVRTIFLLGGWLGSGVFVVYYHLTSRWYHEPLSRYLMSGPLGLLSLYTAGIANSFIPTEWVRDFLRLFMVVVASLFAWYSVVTYHRLRRELKRKEDSNEG